MTYFLKPFTLQRTHLIGAGYVAHAQWIASGVVCVDHETDECRQDVDEKDEKAADEKRAKRRDSDKDDRSTLSVYARFVQCVCVCDRSWL